MAVKRHKVIFQPMGVRAEIDNGATLRSAGREAGVAIDSICGEQSTCGKCRIVVQRGEFAGDGITSRLANLSVPNKSEQAYWEKRRKGIAARGEDPDSYRLSCQTQVYGDAVVMVPESSRAVQQVIRKSATEREIQVRPMVRKLYVELEQATLDNPRADWERVKDALAEIEPLTRGPHHLALDIENLAIDLPALRTLQAAVRDGEWRLTITVWGSREVIRVEPGYADRSVGLAVDIGTTTIAAHLCDLQSGALLATGDMMNPQVGYGEDIMSRMAYAAGEPDGLKVLQNAIIEGLNRLARRVARQSGMKASDIVELVVVGNTAMHHLFLGLDTTALARAPYVPTLHDSLDVKARDAGLSAVNEGAYVHLLPVTASFVGADNMAVLLAEAPHEQDENWLIIDIGTNAELVLGNRERLVCTSTPTGPAFEGAHIEYGMRAAEGAIERVQIDSKTLIPRFKLVGLDEWSNADGLEQSLARGICGSGIIDAVAELFRVGLLKSDGKFARDVQSPNLRQTKDGPVYVLARAEQTTIGRDIPITQEDIRQIQLAKAPLYVAAHYLLNTFGLERPDRILLAGGFGSHIDTAKAMLLGMIPDCPLEKVHAVGNSAGDGARIALLNRDKRREALELSRRMQRIELPAQPGFQDQFILALHLPHMTDPYPHLDSMAPKHQENLMAKRLFGENVPEINKQKTA